MAFALTGARVFDGEAMRDGLAVVVDGDRIRDVVQLVKLIEILNAWFCKVEHLYPALLMCK